MGSSPLTCPWALLRLERLRAASRRASSRARAAALPRLAPPVGAPPGLGIQEPRARRLRAARARLRTPAALTVRARLERAPSLDPRARARKALELQAPARQASGPMLARSTTRRRPARQPLSARYPRSEFDSAAEAATVDRSTQFVLGDSPEPAMRVELRRESHGQAQGPNCRQSVVHERAAPNGHIDAKALRVMIEAVLRHVASLSCVTGKHKPACARPAVARPDAVRICIGPGLHQRRPGDLAPELGSAAG
jgi:hypothetical protein